MEKLLELALKQCEKAEIFSHDTEVKTAIFKNSRLHGVETRLQSGVSIRLIKDGRLGFAFTRNLSRPEELLQNALNSTQAGVVADFDFPFTKQTRDLQTFAESAGSVNSKTLVDECEHVCQRLEKTGAEISAIAALSCDSVRIINSTGTDVSSKSSCGTIYVSTGFPGGGTSIGRMQRDLNFKPMSDFFLDEIALLFAAANKTVQIEAGRMPVLFMPNSTYSLNWRLSAAANARNIHEKTSPLTSRIGEKIFSEKISIYDDPHDNADCSARSFDDEATATNRLTIFEKGVFKNFFSDLNYAKKLKVQPTGHGYRTAQWCNDPVALNPAPAAMNLRFAPGQKSVRQLIAAIDRGIILENCLGAHSGNILNGDLSLGGSPALYVENGEIQGRVDNIMLAGNVYEMLRNVIDLSETPEIGFMSFTPAILIDDIKVAG